VGGVSAIWLLTTRGRPEACQQVLDACEATGMTSEGVVYVDETADLYRTIRLPENWSIRRTTTLGSIAASMRYCQRRFPEATQYGWLADDMIPQTDGWDRLLEEAAGNWRVAYANDLGLAHDPAWAEWVRKGSLITCAPCWGAKLIRAVGWWAPPGMRQGGIDGAWDALLDDLGLGVYLDHVIVEHLSWQSGKRAKDGTDDLPHVQEDVALYHQWVRDERATVVARVQQCCP
jgi:hypothetical protein